MVSEAVRLVRPTQQEEDANVKTGTTTLAEMKEAGTWFAGYFILADQHRDVYNELMRLFNREELIALAKSLPFDKEAAVCVCPSLKGGTFGKERGQWTFNEWLDSLPKRTVPRPGHYAEVAVYGAAAATGAAAKILEEVEELSRQKLAKLNGLKGLLTTAAKSPALTAAIKGQS